MKSGVLYERRKRAKHGEVDIAAIVVRLKTIAGSLRGVGIGMMLLAFAGLAWIYVPLATVEINYALHPQVPEKPSKFGDLVSDWPNWEVPDPAYSLYIPKIKAITKVVPNVDASDEQAYLAALKMGVAASRGLSNPGQKGTTYLFAHSTDSPINFARYNAIFYLLDRLEVGDKIEVSYQGKLYRYAASSREILEPEDVKYLIPQQNEEKLILQTCYPPGTTWRRLVIVAHRT